MINSRDFLAFGIGMNFSIVVMDFILWRLIPGFNLHLTPYSVGVILFGGYILCTTGEKHVRRDSDEPAGDCNQVNCILRQGGSQVEQDV